MCPFQRDVPMQHPRMELLDYDSSIHSQVTMSAPAKLQSEDVKLLMSPSDVKSGALSGHAVSGSDSGPMQGYSRGIIKFRETDEDEEDIEDSKENYMTVNRAESADVILGTLTSKDWGLKLPKLLICMLGGEESETAIMQDVEREICKGLVETVLSTDVWLFTGGLQQGLMKSIGEALTEYATGLAIVEQRDLVAVGVAPFGILKDKDKLSCSPQNQAKKHKRGIQQERIPMHRLVYSEQDDQSGNRLEPNHTHFILVGDKEQGQGIEAEVRKKLINKIASMTIEGTKDTHGTQDTHCTHATIPVIYFVFGGDVTVFETIEDAVNNNIPTIFFPYFGGAAEVLKESLPYNPREMAYHEKVMKLLKTKFKLDGNGANKVKKRIQRISSNSHLINIFDDFDQINGAILNALLTATTNRRTDDSEEDLNNSQHQLLHLAVLWDRIDLAKDSFQHTWNLPWKNHKFVKDLLHYTLVHNQHNQHEFVEFFISTVGINIKEFLSFEELKKLYNDVRDDLISSTLLHQNTKKRGSRDICLADVGDLLKELISDMYDTEYLSNIAVNTNKDPLKELFLWAVLQDRIPMAMVFWKLRGKPSVGGALVAYKLLKAMSKHQLVTDAQKAAIMYEHANEFQQMAIEMINTCYAKDRRRTSDLLVRIMPDWGGCTCLEIAAASRSKSFISHVAVQNLLSELWMGRIHVMTPQLKIGLCVLLPFLSLWLITFTDEDNPSVPLQKRKKRSSTDERDGGAPTSKGEDSIMKDRQPTGGRISTAIVDHIPRMYKLKLFFEAPIVSFCYNMISQFLFLVLFSYIIIANFSQVVSGFEIALMVWVFAIFTEEVRQVLQEDNSTLQHRFQAWLWGYWNCVDLISLVMFAVGVGLRFHPATLDAARIVLALDLMVFYFRILHICSASKFLGPKLIMISKMMVDLVSFICILMVFLIAYGVACQAILYPNSQEPESIARGVLYRSYFQLYGELLLNDNCAANETQLAMGMQPCPSHSWFASVSLAFYLFISNILLLNLLIAMLNYTFTAVQENTDVYWKFQRYQLIKEYYRRPAVVPPFIVIVHLFLLVRYVWDICFPDRKFPRAPNLMKRKLGYKAAAISAWEKVICQVYLERKTAGKKGDMQEEIEMKFHNLSRLVGECFGELMNCVQKQDTGRSGPNAGLTVSCRV